MALTTQEKQKIAKGIESNTDFSGLVKSALEENKITDSEKIRILEVIAKEYPEQKTALSAIYRTLPNPYIKTWNDFARSIITFDDSKDYKSGIFGRRFPMGTISYIGARPARGKTTMLVNIALDAIQQGKNAIYITAEETTKQLLTRFILCTAYERNIKNNLADETTKHSMLYEKNTRTAFYTYMKSKARTLQGIEASNTNKQRKQYKVMYNREN